MMNDDKFRTVLADKEKFLTNLDRVARALLKPANKPFVFGAIEAQLESLKETQEWKTFHVKGEKKSGLPVFMFVGEGLFHFGLRNFDASYDKAVTKQFSELRLENYPEGPVRDAVREKHTRLSSKEDLAERLQAFERDYGTIQIAGILQNSNAQNFIGLQIVPTPNPPHANRYGLFDGMSSTNDPHIRRYAEPITPPKPVTSVSFAAGSPKAT